MVEFRRPAGAHLEERDRITKAPKEISLEVNSLINRAKENAYQSIPLNKNVRERVANAIDILLSPYILEGQIINAQLESPEYRKHVIETREFLRSEAGFFLCSDGRLLVIQLGDPKYANFYRDLQGFLPVRESTRGDGARMVLDNPYISSALWTTAQQMKRTDPTIVPKFVQFVGGHIHSEEPDEEGCGARKGIMVDYGHTPEIGMEYGGVPEFFMDLGAGFNAFDNVVAGAGGECTTIDLVHDAYSQGFIVGLRNNYDKFDRNLNLRENLELLDNNKLILMTEKLDPIFSERIKEGATKRGITSTIDMRNYYNFAQNAMLIGEIAREITAEQEKNGYSFIPDAIKQNKTGYAILSLAYHSIRNVVYRILGGIKPGAHDLERHPEKSIRIGPVGFDFLVKNIPFIENTVPGPFQNSNIDALVKLYQLSYGVLKSQGVNLKTVGRPIFVTGMFDPKLYIDKEKAQTQLNLATHIVQNNAAWVRERFKRSIKTGETVVIGALHEPGTRKLLQIV